MRRSAAEIVVALSCLLATVAGAASPNGDAARKRLDALVARWQSDAPGTEANGFQVRSLILVVDDPRRSLHYAGARGRARAGEPTAITADHSFPIASVTKIMTSVVVYQLLEEGRLGPKGLDATLGELGVFPAAVLDRLDVYEGVPYGRSLTIRQLLGHRSGMRDVLMDDDSATSDELQGAPAPNAIGGLFLADLSRHVECLHAPGCDVAGLATAHAWRPWDRARQDDPAAGVINFYLNSGHTAARPLFRPGESFHYSDTGFIVLGIVIEHLTGKSLAQAYRERIFDRLGLEHSYLDYSDDVHRARHPGPRADYFIGDIGGESARLNLSFDWAGGGVVSTAGDLSVFIRALAEGRLITAASLAELTHWQSQRVRDGYPEDRGFDVERIHAPDGSRFWGHFGAWGAAAFYEPATGISVAGSLNQVNAETPRWMVEVFAALHGQ